MNFSRPHLQPLTYQLWLPDSGTYVLEARQFNRRIVCTDHRSTALQLPEGQALRIGGALARRSGQVIELRPVQPSWFGSSEQMP
jgi:hypothetical protein